MKTKQNVPQKMASPHLAVVFAKLKQVTEVHTTGVGAAAGALHKVMNDSLEKMSQLKTE